MTATASTAAAVRQATRAPLLRPPCTSGNAASPPRGKQPVPPAPPSGSPDPEQPSGPPEPERSPEPAERLARAGRERLARAGPGQRQGPERGDDLYPGGVLTGHRTGRAGAPDPVGLGDPGHHAAEPQGGIAHGEQVGRVDAAACPVGERDQEGRRPIRLLDDDARGSEGRLNLHLALRHATPYLRRPLVSGVHR